MAKKPVKDSNGGVHRDHANPDAPIITCPNCRFRYADYFGDGCPLCDCPAPPVPEQKHPFHPDRVGIPTADDGTLRTFASGATRDTAEGKVDLEGAISPLALWRYGEYMLEHQVQSDGRRRDSDNWQKGFGLKVLIKSLTRHFMRLWRIHRGWEGPGPDDKDLEDALCALIFNAQAYLHEHLVGKRHGDEA